MEINTKNASTEDKRILAQFDEQNIRVYQAYSHKIADEAVSLGTFGSYFKMDRMTWIKPSFLWMMYRAGWATKEGQERILAIDIKRTGFNIILENVVLSAFKAEIYGQYENWKTQLENSQVRCQWDPDRDIFGNPLDRRAIQLGLKGSMVNNYVTDWIVKINDITDTVIEIRESIKSKTFEKSMLPIEHEYPLDERTEKILGIAADA
ncbi:MAG: DUF4291 domain-containing protein [Ruminiclostridium sp.]